MNKYLLPIISVWIARLTSILSLMGSSIVIYLILSDRKRKLSRTKNRFILPMSLLDILQSIAMAFGTALMPKYTRIYDAFGNPTTCNIQAIFLTLGNGVPLYNSSLNIFYMLTIRYNMKYEKFSTTVEPVLHTISILVPVSISIAFFFLGYFQPAGGICYITAMPAARTFMALYSVCFFISFFTMASICCLVIQRGNRMRRYSFQAKQDNERNFLTPESRETIKQAFLYTFAFFLTFIFPYLQFVRRLIGTGKFQIANVLLTSIFYPLQGFWNFVFYIRPTVRNIKNRRPDMCLCDAIRMAIFDTQSVHDLSQRRSSRFLTSQATLSLANRESNRDNETLPELKKNPAALVETDDKESNHENENRNSCIIEEGLSSDLSNASSSIEENHDSSLGSDDKS